LASLALVLWPLAFVARARLARPRARVPLQLVRSPETTPELPAPGRVEVVKPALARR
jgi:hypothetical protein